MSAYLPSILLALVIAWNTFISFMNARVVGLMWNERHVHGTFITVVLWSALVQSAIGFSMPLLMLELAVYKAFVPTTAKFDQAAMSLWYLAIIVPVLGTGLIITVHSWIEMFREKSFVNMATTAYNTVAMAHNLYSASSGIGTAFSKVGEFFNSKDDRDSKGLAALALVALVVLAIVGGALITYGIFGHYRKRSYEIPQQAATA